MSSPDYCLQANTVPGLYIKDRDSLLHGCHIPAILDNFPFRLLL